MGVYIKGMEMPTSCEDCKAFVCYRQYAGDSGDCFCGITKSDAKVGVRNADCPLVPVPAHGRLIDADAVAKMVLGSVNQEDAQGFMFTKIICQSLKDAPTIIPAEEGET